jgi:hypothetical protein
MLIIREPNPPIRHYVYVYINNGAYVIELHKEHPPTRTSSAGFYGQHWIITKARENENVTECVVTTPGGWITRYLVLTRMARKLRSDIAVYEAQQQLISKPVTQSLNSNQHYISQALIRRFSNNGTIQKYTLKYGKWKTSSPKSVFSGFGYNQLVAFGQSNNEVEEMLKPLEDTLPETLSALDDAAKAKETVLDSEIYKRMCSYCAFLWEMSPFIKLAAPFHFVQQLMFDLNVGNIDFLDALGYRDEDIEKIIQHHAKGGKFIITGKNYRQLAYRLQFPKQLASLYNAYRYSTKWTVARSPIELPIGDMALIKYDLPDLKIIRSILPISSNATLIGECPTGKLIQPSTNTIVYGTKLTKEGAEYVRNVICQGAVLTVSSNTRIGNINEWRKRPVVNIMQPQNVEEVIKSGFSEIVLPQEFLLTPASSDDYVKWAHSFIKPPSKETT